MSDTILGQIESNGGKKILDETDVVEYSNNYGSITFNGESTEDESGRIIKGVDTFTSIGYDAGIGETFNSYPISDSISTTDSTYKNNNIINKAFQNYSHARNLGTVANDRQSESVLGQYNISMANGSTSYGTMGGIQTISELTDSAAISTQYPTNYTTNSLLIIGDGNSTSNRHNLLTIRSSCTGNDGAGTLSFSGDVDVDGHLNVNDYIYSPIIYTSNLKYPDGTEFETGSEETFKLFDEDELATSQATALSWAKENTENKSFYRDPETQEIYQIQSNISNEVTGSYVPVANVETVDINNLNMSITGNLFLTAGGGTSTTSDGYEYTYDDFSGIRIVQSPLLISGYMSDEFVEKYCFDYETALKLAAVLGTNLTISADSYYEASGSGETIDFSSSTNKVNSSIEVQQRGSSYMSDVFEDIGYDNLNNYNFFLALRGINVLETGSQAKIMAINKENNKIAMMWMWSSELKYSSGTSSSDWLVEDWSSTSTRISGTTIPKGQLAGTWWAADTNKNNMVHKHIYEAFSEYDIFPYRQSIVPTYADYIDGTLTDLGSNKWLSWYRELPISSVFTSAHINKLADEYSSNMNLLEFLQYAAVYYLEDSPSQDTIKKTSATTDSFGLNNLVEASIVEDLVNSASSYLSYDSSSLTYTVSDESGLITYLYGSSPKIVVVGDAKTVIFKNPIVSHGTFSFTYYTNSIANLFKTYSATFKEYDITLSSDENLYYIDDKYPKRSNTSVTTLSADETTSYKGSNTRYVSQINTGLETATALSLTDNSGTAVLSLLGSEGTIEVDQISWENLIDSLNQNKTIDILGSQLINLKDSLATSENGNSYCLVNSNGNISLTEIDSTDTKWIEIEPSFINSYITSSSIKYRIIGKQMYIKGQVLTNQSFSEGSIAYMSFSNLGVSNGTYFCGSSTTNMLAQNDGAAPVVFANCYNSIVYCKFYPTADLDSGVTIYFQLVGTID